MRIIVDIIWRLFLSNRCPDVVYHPNQMFEQHKALENAKVLIVIITVFHDTLHHFMHTPRKKIK